MRFLTDKILASLNRFKDVIPLNNVSESDYRKANSNDF